jgi:hypothetical protein
MSSLACCMRRGFAYELATESTRLEYLRSIDRASRPCTYGILHVDVVMVMVILLRTPYKYSQQAAGPKVHLSQYTAAQPQHTSSYRLGCLLLSSSGEEAVIMQQHELSTVLPRHASSSLLNPASCTHPLQVRRGLWGLILRTSTSTSISISSKT